MMGLTKIVVKGWLLTAAALGLISSASAQLPLDQMQGRLAPGATQKQGQVSKPVITMSRTGNFKLVKANSAPGAKPATKIDGKAVKSSFTPTAAQKKTFEARLKLNQEAFVENKGQWDDKARFLARTPNLRVWMTDQGWVLDAYKRSVSNGKVGTTGQVVHMEFAGGNNHPVLIPNAPNGSARDYMGPYNKGKIAAVKAYGNVTAKNVYSGIDVSNYIEKGKARFDVIVAPGADPNLAKIKFSGANGTSIDKHGDLIAATNLGDIKFADLKAYQ